MQKNFSFRLLNRWTACLLMLLTLAFTPTAHADTFTPTSDFTVNSDGTVYHKLTGLTWKRCAEGQTWTGSTCTGTDSSYTFDQAKALTSSFAGQTDWRLPTPWELATIVDYDIAPSGPKINGTIFPNTSSPYFWSGSPDAGFWNGAWGVYFGDGKVWSYERSLSLSVRLVRGGQSFGTFVTPTSDFTDNGDGTVTHVRTKLTWKRCAEGQVWNGATCTGTVSTFTFDQAAALTGNFAGKSDWRTPNIQELHSIVEYGTYNPAINSTIFPSTPSSDFWSGSPYALNSSIAWHVYFGAGSSDRSLRSYSYSVRLVRGGQSFDTLNQTGALAVSVAGASGVGITSSTGHSGANSYRLAVAPGTRVSLSAPLSAGGQIFSHWSGCDSNPGSVSFEGCELTMPASGDKRVTAVYTSPGSKMVNISTRAKVLTGDNVLIAGFIISGGAKRVLIKAQGPSMSALGVPGVLANSQLTLYSGQTVLASNDDWGNAAESEAIRASGKAPSHPQEAALLVTLNPGAYTAIVQGVAGSTGIGLVSVDDLDDFSSASRLINISSRAYTSTGGDDQVIAGFILQGNSKQLLMVGSGPSLSKYNVPGVLPDPVLTLYTGQTVLTGNDNWGISADASQIDLLTAGYFLTNEAAIVRTLAPGAYTVIMRGNGTPGIGLIEVDE